MEGLRTGKLDELSVFFDFDDQAKHCQFWKTELDSVRQYYVELVTQTGSFYQYNPQVMQELAYNNEPLDLPTSVNWEREERPRFIHLPYSQTVLQWIPHLNKWQYECHSEDSLSPCSLDSRSSYWSITSSKDTPSLLDPIDDFEIEDRELEEGEIRD